MTARTPQRQQLLELLGPVVSASGYDLEDISVSAAGRRSLVRVTVDGDAGIDLDGVAEVSRAVSEALDADAAGGAAFAGPYVLEVSSPGVDRPLREPRHWRRATGRLVSVTVDSQILTGRVRDADDSAVQIDVEGQTRRFEYSTLGAGKLQVEFARGDEAGSVASDTGEEEV